MSVDTQHMAGDVCRRLNLPDGGSAYARLVINNALMDAVAKARTAERGVLERYFDGKGEAANWSGAEVATAIREGWDEQ